MNDSDRDRNKLLVGLGGIIIGAAVGLLLAPQSGRRTRSLLKDKSVKYSHDVADFTDKKSRHFANKVRGYIHEMKGAMSGRVEAEKEEIEEQQPTS
jgi:gas vesicle protein